MAQRNFEKTEKKAPKIKKEIWVYNLHNSDIVNKLLSSKKPTIKSLKEVISGLEFHKDKLIEKNRLLEKLNAEKDQQIEILTKQLNEKRKQSLDQFMELENCYEKIDNLHNQIDNQIDMHTETIKKLLKQE